MAKRITEQAIEELAISLLEEQQYKYLYGPDISPEGISSQRDSYEQVLLIDQLEESVKRINPSLPRKLLEDAIRKVTRIASTDLMNNNETFHTYLTEGVPVAHHVGGYERGERVWLVDFDNEHNNDYHVVNQFTVVENSHTKRPDIILFVNGMPLVVIELKNPTDENTTVQSAFRQIETYKSQIPGLFTYNAAVVLSDGCTAKAGTISSGFSRFLSWKTADGKNEAGRTEHELGVLISGMLNHRTLLDLIRHFIVFETNEETDPETEVITINTVKKIAAYHQYYAVNKAVDSTLRASGFRKKGTDTGLNLSPASYGLTDSNTQPVGDRKGGVVWHTQGSGKSLSMVFYAGKLVLEMNNPTLVVITDRNDLDDQLFGTFSNCRQLLRQTPVQAKDREHLKQLLKVASGGIIFTTIQKFHPESGKNIYDTLSERENIVVIADEAHRSQYGFQAKIIEEKNKAGETTGSKTVYGFAKYLRDALPYATYLGFTGTPIEKNDANTPAVFGNYVDIYDIAQAVNDGATVRIYYESRLAKVQLTEEGRRLIATWDDEYDTGELTENQKAKAKWTQLEALVGSEQRVRNIARDIIEHFESRQSVFEGKGMIVAMSRRIAAELYEEIIQLRPHWHSDNIDKGVIKVVMTANSSEGPLLARHHTTKKERRRLAERMKSPDDELKLVIVRDMWLTGFDAPSMHTLYIDKPMQGHNLMQAIARVNRVYQDKPGGLVVDYLGIAADLKKALSFYSDAGGKGDPATVQKEAVDLVLEKLTILSDMFHGFPYENFFEADTAGKLNILLAAEDFILGLDNGKKRFTEQVQLLSSAFAIAIPHEEALAVKDEVSFFQAVKARLVKFEINENGRSNIEIETTIRQVIDKALASNEVIDVFGAAGLNKPNISVLSDEFMAELKNMQHKNIAIETLKKLLNEEIRSRARTNLVVGKSLMEMLENSIRRYHNKIITAAEVIDELIRVGKEITNSDKKHEELGLTEYEYAFYSAVANNNSAREIMEQEQLRDLAIQLFETIRKNASIDWTLKESVKAKLRVAVKRLLRKYGYPPDMEKLATETVLKQAKKIAEELTKK